MIKEFQGNGTGGSVALRLFSTYIEYEHKNYFVAIPIGAVKSISYSKDSKPVYASVSINDVSFGCENKVEVYAALVDLIASK